MTKKRLSIIRHQTFVLKDVNGNVAMDTEGVRWGCSKKIFTKLNSDHGGQENEY